MGASIRQRLRSPPRTQSGSVVVCPLHQGNQKTSAIVGHALASQDMQLLKGGAINDPSVQDRPHDPSCKCRSGVNAALINLEPHALLAPDQILPTSSLEIVEAPAAAWVLDVGENLSRDGFMLRH